MSTSNERRLKNPWPLVAGIVFFLALALSLFFLLAGVSSGLEDYKQGYIHVSLEVNAAGQVVLDPATDYEAATAGVKKGDLLLSVNGQPVPANADDVAKMLGGRVGDLVTIRVQKADGSQETYTIVRSSHFLKNLEAAGLTLDSRAAYFVTLSVLVGLLFAALAVYILLRRPTDWQFVLAAFALLFFPYSLNACYTAHSSAMVFNLVWLYNLLRASGLLLTFGLLLVFPSGTFVPKWSRWALVAVAVWVVPYYISMVIISFLPSVLLDVAWQIIIAIGIGIQVYRYLRVSSVEQRQQTRPMVIAAVAALIMYLVSWVVNNLVPGSIMSGSAWIWYYLIIELLVDAALLFFGFGVARAVRKNVSGPTAWTVK